MQQKKNRVYRFDCRECKSWYIGETGQKMEKRTYQHQNDVKNGRETNAIFMHLFCKSTRIITSNGNKFHISNMRKTGRREKLRKLCISMQWIQRISEIMNLEKGFEINPRWNEFNPHIRNIAQKKGKL